MNVLLLTQDNCYFCEVAKEMLLRLADEYGFTLSMLDLDSDRGQALALQGGILFPPGIFIDEEAITYGRPSEKRLRKEIEQRVSQAPSVGSRSRASLR